MPTESRFSWCLLHAAVQAAATERIPGVKRGAIAGLRHTLLVADTFTYITVFPT